MLVLSRKKNESIVINNDITVTVVEIRGDKVRLGIVAPKEVPVHRQEVYDAIHGKAEAMRAVCEQGEWDEMERARPGYHTLVRAGITNEGEAERLARGTSGDVKGRR